MKEEVKGFYYLHSESKDLIYKRFKPDDSDFVVRIWEVDFSDRFDAWRVVLEALALGAKLERIKELAKKWKLTIEDSYELIFRSEPTDDMEKGLNLFVQEIFNIQPIEYWEKAKVEYEKRFGKSCEQVS
jgi:hypothetical protein